MTLPNFVHLGPGKSGSTWLHETMLRHPDVFLTEAKDLYFFSRYYDRGPEWYERHFRAAGSQPVVGEVCPEYLWFPAAAARIRETLGPDVRLVVTLREPVERAFSSFLYLRKHGLARETFRDTVRDMPEIVDEGRYATHLRRYVDLFGASSIKISLFDQLQADPQAFYDDIVLWLGLERQELTPAQREAVLPASQARWLPLAATAQRGAEWVRRHDGAALVGVVKRSPVVQRLLYRPLSGDGPRMSPEDREAVREMLRGELEGVDRQLGTSLVSTWHWD